MNLTTLQTYLAILESGSLVGAAQRLNVTQSTVTARLQSLETELGQTLLVRQKSGALPTAAGVRLKRYAETMEQLWQQARTELAMPREIQAICNIGCHPDLWPGLGELLFENIRTQRQDVALSVWQGGQIELSTWQNSGLTDISLTYWPSTRSEHENRPLPSDSLVLVSTNPQAPVRFDPGYVFVEAGDAFGRWHTTTYADANVARLSFGSAVLGLQHILAHGGSAYLPDRMVQEHVATGSLHRISQAPEFERPASMVISSNSGRAWPWLDQVLQEVLSV